MPKSILVSCCMANFYFLSEGDSAYVVVVTKKSLDDPVGAIQEMFDDDGIAAFVGFVDPDFAKKTAAMTMKLAVLPKGFHIYIVRVRFNDLVALYYNKIDKNVQLFGELKELKDKFVVEELFLKLSGSKKHT